jgi:hypothetical protein
MIAAFAPRRRIATLAEPGWWRRPLTPGNPGPTFARLVRAASKSTEC